MLPFSIGSPNWYNDIPPFPDAYILTNLTKIHNTHLYAMSWQMYLQWSK